MRASSFTRLIWPLSAAMLSVSTAQAMEIRKYKKMADQDQSDYQ
jgi:hypothetical protein